MGAMAIQISEAEYRARIQETFDRISKALDPIDPDTVECDVAFGALSLKFADGSKVILSAQPSVRQLWMAVTSRAIAVHFNWDGEGSRWVDDRGAGTEILSFLAKHLKDSAGIDPNF